MMVNFLLYLFISYTYAGANCSNPNHSYAKDATACNRNYSTTDITNQIHEIQDTIEWWGASTEQVSKASCKTTTPPTAVDMSEVTRSKEQSRKVTKTIHGVRFENESKELVDAFEKLTSRNSVYGGSYGVKEAQTNVQALHQINPSCKNVSCAMEKIWGAELGQKILYIKLKHGYNASEIAFDNSSRFTLPEINDVLMTLEDLPPSLQPLGHNGNQRLVPYTVGQSVYGPDERVVANSGVIFFDRWRESSSLTRQYTAFHELSHNISSRHENADSSTEWMTLSGWKRLGDAWEMDPNACMISKYGKASPAEDFAEVLSAYRYNSRGLEKACPIKYNYMKAKVFGGMEYKDSSQCARANPDQIESVQKNLAEHFKVNNYSLNTALIQNECGGSLSSYPPAQNEIENCAFQASLKAMPTERLNEIVRSSGLPINASTRRAISRVLPEASPLRVSLQAQSRQVDQIVESAVVQYRAGITQLQPPSKQSNAWFQTQSRCGFVMLEMPENALGCYVETLYAEDKKMKEWGAGFLPKLELPSIFSEKALTDLKGQDRKLVEDALSKNPQFLAQYRESKSNFKRNIISAIKQMKQSSSQLPQGWQNLSPAEFCSKAYASSNMFLNIWGFKDGDPVKAIEEECVKKQTRSRRFHPTDSDWESWINSRWN